MSVVISDKSTGGFLITYTTKTGVIYHEYVLHSDLDNDVLSDAFYYNLDKLVDTETYYFKERPDQTATLTIGNIKPTFRLHRRINFSEPLAQVTE
jgi:hypothetical protein